MTKTITERRHEINEELLEDIREIKGLLLAIQKADAARVERENRMRDDVDGLKETVNGNGKAGIKTDVELLKASDRKRTANQNAIIVAVIIQIIMTVIAKL